MKTTLIKLTMLVLATALIQSVTIAQKADPAEVQLKAAIQKEVEDGDFRGAIEQYKKIVATAGASRSVVARALLHLGLCSEKLGNAEAGKCYEQLVREFSDQTEVVAEARTRLAALQAAGNPNPAGPVDQLAWIVPAGRFLAAGPSQEGRYVLSGNMGRTVLWLHDLVRGTDRKLVDLETSPNGGMWSMPAIAPDSKSIAYLRAANSHELNYGPLELWTVDTATGRNRKLVDADPQHGMSVIMFVFSPDSQQIAYEWDGKEDAELHLVSLDGSRARVLASSRGLAKEPGHYRVFTDGWSPDGKFILASGWRFNNDYQAYMKSRVYALISVADDNAQLLGKDLGQIYGFSPDSKYLACQPVKSGISIISVEGGNAVPLFSDPAQAFYSVHWMPDGRSIVLRSNRSGTVDLWAVPLSNGRPAGEPVRLKQNIASGNPFGLSRAGTYYYGTRTTERNIYVADLDPETGKLASKPERLNQTFINSSASPVDWSPDGKFLAYTHVSQSMGLPSTNLVVRTVSTAREKEIAISPAPSTSNFGLLKWFPDSQSLLMADGEVGHFMFRQVDRETGSQKLLLDRPGLWYQAALSIDGKSLYYSAEDASARAGGLYRPTLFRRDLEKGEESKMYQATSPVPGLRSLALSPDGRQLAFLVENKDGSTTLQTVPAGGGANSEIYRSQLKLSPCVWTRDGRHLLVVERDPKSGHRLLSVSVDGGEPIFTGLSMEELDPHAMSVHPDGRRIAFAGGATRQELWMITNLLPSSQ